MSRICLMLLVVLSLVCVQAAMSDPRVSVGDASSLGSSAARGGACALSYYANNCSVETFSSCDETRCKRVAEHSILGDEIPESVHYECTGHNGGQAVGYRRLKQYLLGCVPISISFGTFDSTTCLPAELVSCWEHNKCFNNCVDIEGVNMCKSENSIYKTLFSLDLEEAGDGMECHADLLDY